jgi:hypothetical protein
VVLPGLTVISACCWLLHLLLPTAGVGITAAQSSTDGAALELNGHLALPWCHWVLQRA